MKKSTTKKVTFPSERIERKKTSKVMVDENHPIPAGTLLNFFQSINAITQTTNQSNRKNKLKKNLFKKKKIVLFFQRKVLK